MKVKLSATSNVVKFNFIFTKISPVLVEKKQNLICNKHRISFFHCGFIYREFKSHIHVEKPCKKLFGLGILKTWFFKPASFLQSRQ